MSNLNKLTENRLKRLSPGHHFDSDAAGLVVFVDQAHTKQFLFNYKSHSTGKMEVVSLGRNIKLSKARLLALSLARSVIHGHDPKHLPEHRTHQTISFKEASDCFLRLKSSEWRNDKHRKNWIQSLEDYALPIIGHKAVSDITIQDVLAVLSPIWQIKSVTAERLRQRIKLILDWAMAHGYREGGNPADHRTGVGQLLPKVKKIHTPTHHSALPWAMAPDLVGTIVAKEGQSFRALEMLLLTATRTNEVVGAKWEEFDFERRIWTVPAKRTKNFRELRVPITDHLIEILSRLNRKASDAYVFTNPRTRKPMGLSSPRNALKGISPSYTPHGLRSTFREWAAEKTQFRREAIELSLGHTVARGAEAAYWRSDLFEERVVIMQAWEDFIYEKIIDK
jgi:integrase